MVQHANASLDFLDWDNSALIGVELIRSGTEMCVYATEEVPILPMFADHVLLARLQALIEPLVSAQRVQCLITTL